MDRCPRCIGYFIGILAILFVMSGAAAAQQPESGMDNAACLACHSNPSITYQFPSGEVWSLTLDPESFDASVHGQKGMRCTACHTDITSYPHPSPTVASRRYYQLEHYKSCEACHPQVYREALDSVHARQIASGNWAAAICTDCHDPHRAPSRPKRIEIPVTCSKCHFDICNEYLESIHGKALVEAGNPDVPTCTDCHGVHTQEDPRTTQLRSRPT